MILYNYMLGKF